MQNQDLERAIAEVWSLFKATDAKIAKISEDMDKLSKATDEKINKVSLQIAEMSREVAKTSEEVTRVSREVAKTSEEVTRVSNIVGNLTDKWGKFVENFIVPGIPIAFTNRGIKISHVMQRLKATDLQTKTVIMEIDHLAVNNDSVIVIEVKSTLKVHDVDRHIEKIKKFRDIFKEYQDRKVYGAVAGVEIISNSDEYAKRNGLFVLSIGSDSVSIANEPDFIPIAW